MGNRHPRWLDVKDALKHVRGETLDSPDFTVRFVYEYPETSESFENEEFADVALGLKNAETARS